MTSIDIRDVVESIINNQKRHYIVNLDEFKIIYDKVSNKLSDKMVFLFQVEKQIHAIFYEAPNVNIEIKEDYFIKQEEIVSFIDKKRAYLDLIEKEITFLSFLKNELTEKYNLVYILSILFLYLPLQLYINNHEIVKIIMNSMLIFVSIFFSIFLSFITMYGIESAKKMSRISLYYEYMTNSHYILILVLMGVTFTVLSLVSIEFNFLLSVISSSFSFILIIFFIRSIINYYFKYAKFINYKEIIDREFKNKSQEFFERFKNKKS